MIYFHRSDEKRKTVKWNCCRLTVVSGFLLRPKKTWTKRATTKTKTIYTMCLSSSPSPYIDVCMLFSTAFFPHFFSLSSSRLFSRICRTQPDCECVADMRRQVLSTFVEVRLGRSQHVFALFSRCRWRRRRRRVIVIKCAEIPIDLPCPIVQFSGFIHTHTHTCVERWKRCANGIPNAKRNKLERHDVNACGTRELNKYLAYGTERLVKYTSTGGGGRTQTARHGRMKLVNCWTLCMHRTPWCDVPLESWIEHFFRCRCLVVVDVVVDALWLHHTSHNSVRVIFNIIERQENWSNFSVVFCELFATGCLCWRPKTMAERRTRRIDRHIRGNSLN